MQSWKLLHKAKEEQRELRRPRCNIVLREDSEELLSAKRKAHTFLCRLDPMICLACKSESLMIYAMLAPKVLLERGKVRILVEYPFNEVPCPQPSVGAALEPG